MPLDPGSLLAASESRTLFTDQTVLVSVLWALGGDQVRDTVQAAHEGEWCDALSHFETKVAVTRLGTNGVAQVDVDGVTVAAFGHWFNRAGDPQLHTHLAVSAMVRASGSGRWRRPGRCCGGRGPPATH